MGYTVYKLTSPSDKVYIGITSRSVKDRWSNGKGYKQCPAIYNAIQKYGWGNFKKEILFEDMSEIEAKNFETMMIRSFQSNDARYGYNLTEGGDGTFNLPKHIREQKAERQRGAKNGHAKKVICLETLKVYDTMTQAREETGAKKITECCRHYYKHKTSAGLHWEFYDDCIPDEEYKRLLQRLIKEEYENKHHPPSEENRKKTSERSSVPVICVEIGTIFNSMEDACRKYNISKSNLCNCCKGKRRTAGGFHWEYA